LKNLGYPKFGTKEAESILKKIKSFETCAVGTISEGASDKKKRGGKF
jgi:hypothetical protein